MLTRIVNELGELAIVVDEEVVEPIEREYAREEAPEQNPVLSDVSLSGVCKQQKEDAPPRPG